MVEFLCFALIICISAAIANFTGSSSKRGCGGGCAACGNRSTCHRKK
ncbi:MAG: hypothetical protein HFI10_03285 [Lachnospiraceae bacterium]|nr:hypothetical protein [Lachnospiraceae bacterium]